MPIGCPTEMSEDCLYLNVYTPRDMTYNNSAPAPVMVFFPGGRFEQGTAGTPLYIGGNLANVSRAVLVTTNYRLSGLGWMTTEAEELTGNYGFHDQLTVLKWVQKNAAAFGGDPNNVVIFGQSAGGTSVAAHLASKLSTGLFHKAIIQSNPFTLHMKTRDDANKIGKAFAKAIGCDASDVACLRGKTMEEVIVADKAASGKLNLLAPLSSFYPWTPLVDGTVLTDQPWRLYQQGNYNKVPVIMGTVSQEGVLFVYEAVTNNMTRFEYNALVDALWKVHAVTDVLPHYRGQPGDDRPVLSRLANDFILACLTRRSVQLSTNYMPDNTFLYQYSHLSPSAPKIWGKNHSYCGDAVCHGSELACLFNSAGALGVAPTPAEEVLATQMESYWGNFAWSGNPNQGPNTPNIAWPKYTNATDMNMQLDTPTATTTHLLKDYCDMWDSIGYEAALFGGKSE